MKEVRKMDKKMTSGEIAKKAGVSQKAVRLYDEKGLLKPTDYSEGNYRLYDKAALQVLEKIVALKQIGFSLEEIRDNILAGDAKDIKEALELQKKSMEEKRYRIDMTIDAISRTLAQEGDLDWDDVAGIVQSVTLDQEADRGHWLALQHTVPGQDWYVTVFKSMNFKKDEKVLDLGCGYSKIWRNNWKDIPEGTKIYGYDIPGSWAEDFAEFVKENGKDLPAGVSIDLIFEDLEKDAAWEKIEKEKDYTSIIAHYIDDELKDTEALVEKASKVLAKDGIFSINGRSIPRWYLFFEAAMKDLGIDAPFIEEIITEKEGERDDFRAMAGKYFGKVEEVTLPSSFRYDDAQELVDRMKECFPGQEKFFCKYQDKIMAYFAEKISRDGEVIVCMDGTFLRCSI